MKKLRRRHRRTRGSALLALGLFVLVSCSTESSDSGAADADSESTDSVACDAEPDVLTTFAGVDFVRTPDSCFDDLPDWPYESQYVEIDGLRQAYVDEGPEDGPVVLLLHGQPSWSYLYRDMVPVLAGAGYRVIAMDHLGMGRSDKPVDIEDYSYTGHAERLESFIDELGLADLNLFVQDWGSLIGLKVAGENPDLFASIAVGDGALPVIPAGTDAFPPVENPNEVTDLEIGLADIPAQQPEFYNGCEPISELPEGYFGDWMAYAMTSESFMPSLIVEAMTYYDLTPEEEAAYDAPFPSRTYMAGPRVFPSLVNDVDGNTADAWAGLQAYEKPFITIWASNDPGQLGSCEAQQRLTDNVPGAEGQDHTRLPEASHFLQDDQGTEIANRLIAFYDTNGIGPNNGVALEESAAATQEGRYCEIVLVHEAADGTITAEVWGTQAVNTCPRESWEALDPQSIKAETGAVFVRMNGPRVGLMSSVTGSILDSEERRTFGDLDMRLLTELAVDGDTVPSPYTEVTVLRTTTFVWDAGEEIYELTSPDGNVYVMQSMSQIVDPTLVPDDLAALGTRLELPPGWTYEARRLDEDLRLTTDNDAVVLQDELQNSYQRV
jgi:haloalkane dehalogenase